MPEPKGDCKPGAILFAATLIALCRISPAAGQTVDTLSYWLNQTKGISKPYSCTAGNVSDPTTYFRQYLGGPNDCPGLTVYQIAKGESGHNLWGTETYYANSGFVKIIQEVASYYRNPPADCIAYGFTTSCDHTRAFRDNASGSKGIPTVPLTFANGWSYNHLPYTEETWVTGYRVCSSNDHVASVPGSGRRIEMYQGPTLVGFLRDRRGPSPPNTWYDVQTIERHDFWGVDNEERYWYGRWLNPQTQQWEGLGLVMWQAFENGQPLNNCGLQGNQPCMLTNHFLVDCNAVVPCWSCPP